MGSFANFYMKSFCDLFSELFTFSSLLFLVLYLIFRQLFLLSLVRVKCGRALNVKQYGLKNVYVALLKL